MREERQGTIPGIARILSAPADGPMETPPPPSRQPLAASPGTAPSAVSPAGSPGAAGTAFGRRRLPYIRAFFKALVDPETFDARRNPSVWLGALLAVPIPILLAFTKSPAWVEVLAFSSPVAWGAILGAAGRVATVESEAVHRLELQAAAAKTAAAAATVRGDRLEAEQQAMTAELKLAQAIQRTMVPPDIVRPDVQVVVKHIPSSFVGGDYLQASTPRPDVLYLCVGDVSGHGVAAALVVSRLHGVVRRLILEQKSPVQFLDELNKVALGVLQHTYFFVTFAVFRIDLTTRRIEYATAGHPAQLLLRADGRVEPLSTPNRLLGMDVDVFDPDRPTDATTFEPGDSLVLFTDGLFEIPGQEDGEILGEQGLGEMLGNLGGLPPALIAGDVLRELADFQGDSKFEDDVSLMVARFDPVAAVPATSRAAAQPATAQTASAPLR